MHNTKLLGLTIAFSAAATLAFAAGKPTPADKTYVGCVEKSGDRSYDLTHILGAQAAGTASEIHLESPRVDLSKYVGQKVSVRGIDAAASGSKTALTVSMITKLAKSCS